MLVCASPQRTRSFGNSPRGNVPKANGNVSPKQNVMGWSEGANEKSGLGGQTLPLIYLIRIL